MFSDLKNYLPEELHVRMHNPLKTLKRNTFLVTRMVRASKLPLRNFEYNTKRAVALARLDGYLEDLLHNEGKGTIGAFLNLSQELMKLYGIDKLMRNIERTMEAHFKAEIDKKGKEYFENIGKDVAKRLKSRAEKISEIFQDLGLLMEQTLLEQALIVAVSAFEVYLKEIVVSVVTLNKSIRKRFHEEISAGLSLAKLEEYKEDARRTQGEIVADLVRLEIPRIKSVLKRLVGAENIFGDHKTEKRILKIFEKRHIIIHRAGLVDPKYKKVTKYRGAIDKQIAIKRRYVLRSISLLTKLVNKVEDSIRSSPSSQKVA